MRILVLGGDGFCGWPASLHLSAAGHEVAIADSFARRGADDELGAGSLTPIRSLNDRVAAWRETGGAPIAIHAVDVAQGYDELREVLASWRPDAVVHGAQQRAAPYSMRTASHKRYTVDNNVSSTHNLLAALVEAGVGAHVVHLGTAFGVPGSVAHLTMALDRELFAFYAANDGLRITDLRLGIVWGTQTPETLRDERLVNRFDYDGDYGTVVNRFCAQAATGHPLQIHGTGLQTRPFVALDDAVRGVAAAVADPPAGEPLEIDLVAEVHAVRSLADRVAAETGAEITSVEDPRLEEPAHGFVPPGSAYERYGLEPTVLDGERLREITALAARHADRLDARRVPSSTRWVADGSHGAAVA